jgi:hypothetical protein
LWVYNAKENDRIRETKRAREIIAEGKTEEEEEVNNSTPSLPTLKHISFSSLSSSWSKICVKPHRLERTRRKESN